MEKKERIWHAALQQFYDKGFEAASTNQITKAAGVSKGILFHYYTDKKTLYLSIVDDCIEHYYKKLVSQMNNVSDDLFEALQQLSDLKIQLFREEPIRYGIVAKAFLDSPSALRDELQARQQKWKEMSIPLLVEKVDRKHLRADINMKLAIEFVMTALEAILLKLMSNQADRKQLDIPSLQMEVYIDMLKYGVYNLQEEEKA